MEEPDVRAGELYMCDPAICDVGGTSDVMLGEPCSDVMLG